MRRRMLVVAIAAGLAAGGCKKGGLDGKLDELAKLRDTMCACKDKACAEAQHDAYVAWKRANSKDDKPSDEQLKKFGALRHEIMKCRHKLDDAASGDGLGAPPAGSDDAPAPAPAAAPGGSAATP